ncbi:unnamed protein product [Gadus morhua 'NCC']
MLVNVEICVPDQLTRRTVRDVRTTPCARQKTKKMKNHNSDTFWRGIHTRRMRCAVVYKQSELHTAFTVHTELGAA